MRTLHQALIGIGLVAIVVISVGATQPWIASALAQHGRESGIHYGHSAEVLHQHTAEAQHQHGATAQDHFHALVGQLELSEKQQQALAEPFQEAFAAMQELHHLHDVITEQLTDEQKDKLAGMIHEMIGASFAEQQNGHAAPHEVHN